MHLKREERVVDLNPLETAEWVEALDQILDETGPDRAAFLVEKLSERARAGGAELPIRLNTPYINTSSHTGIHLALLRSHGSGKQEKHHRNGSEKHQQ